MEEQILQQKKLQVLQNFAARIVKMRKCDDVSEGLKSLGCLDINPAKTQVNDYVMMYKCLNDGSCSRT